MKKVMSSALIIVLALIALVSAGKDAIVRVSLEKGVEAVTGVPLRIESLKVGILKTLVDIGGFKLYNPPGFEDKVMADMPEIFIDYDLPAIIKGKIHLYEARINLKEMVVVKNARGELNLDALTSVKKGETPARTSSGKTGTAPEFRIDKLKLTIGKVVYRDYSRGGNPSIQEFNIGLDEEYTDIDDPTKLANVIIVKAIMNTTIAKLTNFDLQSLQGSVNDTLATAQKLVGSAGDTLLKTTEGARGAVASTTDTVKKTTEGLTQAIKLPFGSKK